MMLLFIFSLKFIFIMAEKRLNKELQDVSLMPLPDGWTYGPSGDSTFDWTATIIGPSGSPYEGGVFFLELIFSADYPFKSPKIKFITRIYHLNISKGSFQLEMLEDWDPSFTIKTLLVAISDLLANPNPNPVSDPKKLRIYMQYMEPEITNLYKTDRAKYEATAKEWTRKYAI